MSAQSAANEKKTETRKAAGEAVEAGAEAVRQGAEGTRQAAEDAARQGAEGGRQLAEAGTAQVRKVIDNTAEQARAAMEQGAERMSRGAEGMLRVVEDAAEFGRGNLEAMSKVAQVWTIGLQDLSRQYVTMTQGLTDHALEGAKALAATKSLKEAAEVQASFTRAAIERATSEGAKIQEQAFRLAEQAAQPLTQRLSVAMEKMGRQQAA